MEQNKNKNEEQQPPLTGAELTDEREGSETINSETPIITADVPAEATTLIVQSKISPDSNSDEPKNETMEVQKHPHHVMHKKKWSEYVLEFFMIFFAVFLGFVAENIREKLAEKSREKEYIRSMIEDLQTDKAKFDRSITANQIQINGYDTLIASWYNKPYSDTSIRVMYYLYRRYTATSNPMIFAMRSFSQLKNAGGMQFIRNKIASDSILEYYDGVEKLNHQLTTFRDESLETLTTSYSIFDWSYLRGISNSLLAYKILVGNRKMAFLNASIQEENKYIAGLQLSRAVLGNYLIWLTDQRTKCFHLIEVLHQQYHLKNG